MFTHPDSPSLELALHLSKLCSYLRSWSLPVPWYNLQASNGQPIRIHSPRQLQFRFAVEPIGVIAKFYFLYPSRTYHTFPKPLEYALNPFTSLDNPSLHWCWIYWSHCQILVLVFFPYTPSVSLRHTSKHIHQPGQSHSPKLWNPSPKSTVGIAKF